MTERTHAESHFLAKADMPRLFDVLRRGGYTIVGPKVDQAAIVYDELHSIGDLPQGWTEEQEAGQYRLVRRDDDAWFGYTVGPHSWKRYLFPPLFTVAKAERRDSRWEFQSGEATPPKYAFVGVRACELAAIAVQDRTFVESAYVDPVYQGRREQAFIIAVNCTQSAPTCFCESMQTGPRCKAGFDLALTELADGFVVEIGSDRGEKLLTDCGPHAVTPAQVDAAEERREGACGQERTMPTEGIRDALLGNLEHPRWDEVAQRCLSCTNCTMVCPTCFCCSVSDVPDLEGQRVDRERKWDSCFDVDFSYMNGSLVRNDVRSRYRQWLTHKLASWIDQFG
ncbi:MAG TPA: 4Fe-4S dicluster domain-containing protein, partial [Planctomycetaceae bacterium]|nr:4Fe-4S dicluster domain-containing protein [Planctomycetaceae bacterium]